MTQGRVNPIMVFSSSFTGKLYTVKTLQTTVRIWLRYPAICRWADEGITDNLNGALRIRGGGHSLVKTDELGMRVDWVQGSVDHVHWKTRRRRTVMNGGETQKGGQNSQELPQKLWLKHFCCIRHEVCVSSTSPYPHVPLQSIRSQMGLRGFSLRAKQLSFSVSPAGRG